MAHSLAYRLGGITTTIIIPAAIGLWLGYKVLKYFLNKKTKKNLAKLTDTPHSHVE